MKVRNEKGWQATSGGVQLGAVLSGVAVGGAAALAGGIVLGILTLQVLAVEAHLNTIASVWGVVSLVGGGLWAGRRAGAKGWLNGGLAGILMVLAATGLSLIMVRSSVTWLAVGRNLGLGLLVGALAGTIGVNID